MPVRPSAAVLFPDRTEAGRLLAGRLASYAGEQPMVLGLARGGVVVAAEVARRLGAPLDVMVARKLGAPGEPELGVGAVAPGVRVLDEGLVTALHLSAATLERLTRSESAEMARRLERYRGRRPEPVLRGRTVIVVDDGLATGVTARAAVRSLRRQEPRRIVFAAPVCAPEAAELLRTEADEVVCVAAPLGFTSVGASYARFEQTTDEEVVALLARAVAEGRAAPTAGSVTTEPLVERCRRLARPLQTMADLDPLLEQIGEARYVLIGEASHGTSDFYLWRARITQRLIREHGFSFVAVEGDWPDCYRVNRYVKGEPHLGRGAHEALRDFTRWPTWMWANWEVAAFVDWLRRDNGTRPSRAQVGFYGLDVYSLWDSLGAVMQYLARRDGSAMAAARQAYRCFEPYRENLEEYARSAGALVPASCRQEVVAMLAALRGKAATPGHADPEAEFVAEQNALVVGNAEAYYRAMLDGGAASWNVRDRHMVETLERLMARHGPRARAIVWEHNTHVGDARATDMTRAGMVNVGQLTRERHAGDGVVLVGFASHRGSVIAAPEWDAPMRRMTVPPARPGSWEHVLHQVGHERALLRLADEAADDEALVVPRGHRAIGVVYEPEHDGGNYVPTVLRRRYDALVYLDQSHALHPLGIVPQQESEPPDLFPWNM